MGYILVWAILVGSEFNLQWFYSTYILLQGDVGQLEEMEEEIVRSVMEHSVHTAHIESIVTGSQAETPLLSKHRYICNYEIIIHRILAQEIEAFARHLLDDMPFQNDIRCTHVLKDAMHEAKKKK